MLFDVLRMRREGNLLPRHMMWPTKVRGDLYLREEVDRKLNRTVRVASIRDHSYKELIPPLLDAVLLSAKPDWWTMTGWERVQVGVLPDFKAVQQSWILIPTDQA